MYELAEPTPHSHNLQVFVETISLACLGSAKEAKPSNIKHSRTTDVTTGAEKALPVGAKKIGIGQEISQRTDCPNDADIVLCPVVYQSGFLPPSHTDAQPHRAYFPFVWSIHPGNRI